MNGYERTISFRLNPIVTGVNHNQTTTVSKTVSYSGGSATLNGNAFTTGTTITQAGNYQLIITGVNDEPFTYDFVLTEVVTGLTNNSTYAGEVTPTITGAVSMTLNGNAYSSGTKITNPGDQILIITGVNNYERTYNFFVNLVVTGVTHQSIYTNTPVTIVFSGGSATLNGNLFTSTTTISHVGHYELIILGVNDFSQTITFTIQPNIQNLTNGITYQGSVTPSILGSNITFLLNGEAYNSGTIIDNPGANELLIQSSIGDYSKLINFDIELIINISNSETYHNITTPQFSGGIATLNGERFESNTPILTFGSFSLIIQGYRNDFEVVYLFSISPFTISLPQQSSIYESYSLDIISLHDLTEVFHNGEKTTETKNILLIGHHQVKVYFSGMLLEDKTFTVEPTYIQDGTTLYEPLIFNQLLAEVKINQVTMNGNVRIDSSGSYFIQVYGVNDYYHEFTFHVVNVIEDISQFSIIPISIGGVIVLFTWFIRKRFVQ